MNFYTTTNTNWDHSIDHTDPFESALSSMVSSPAASATPAAVHGSDSGGVQLIELIGKLGSICSPSQISPHSYIASNNNNNDNSRYSTPMNSPPKLNLSTADQIRGQQLPALTPFVADPGFAERAARFSCFGSRSFNGRISSQLSVNDAELTYNYNDTNSVKLQRVSSCQFPGSQPDKIQIQTNNFASNRSNSKEESSVSQKVQSNEAIGRKRKAVPRAKAKDSQSSKVGAKINDSDSKREKTDDNEKGGKSAEEEKSNENSKPAEPFKDYIHVRARRGQATDSHSLAERVRREKISERMKFLQDLVPGCNKVTGKAVMLDEIINYVQSLQRQVEFLSMKLATVNPRMDSVHMETLLSKEILQSRGNMYHVESSNSASATFPYAYQSQEPPCLPTGATDSQFCNNLSVNGFCNSVSQVSMWEDELHNVVQMGFGAGSTEPFHMKMEP
ncbi:unnamed protein product [Rhodiola kirilowii]